MDVLRSVFKYNISLKDYFCFRFFEKNDTERRKWAGTGFMYEYQLRMNPKKVRAVLENKIHFLHHFQSFVNREFCTLVEIKADPFIAKKLLSGSAGRIVLKNSLGQVGENVEVVSCDKFSPESLVAYMVSNKYDLAEEYIIQHPALMELSPSGVNTVRIFTQLNGRNVDFLGARLRICVNSFVDNMAAGNLAAPIEMKTGIVYGPGVYNDITKKDMAIHPVTGKAVIGFVIPYWNAVLELAFNAALKTPENRSVGWDIAITGKGPELIEGNHNWCKILWQLPVKQGLKSELVKYL